MANVLQRQALQQSGDQSQTFLKFAEQWPVALDAGLVAAADVYVEAVTARLGRGYTSGAFVGQDSQSVADSVRRSKPYSRRDGNRAVNAGTNLFYAGFWEFGHQNPFTGRYERVEHFRLAMLESGEQMAQSFHGVFDTVLGQARIPSIQRAA